MWKNTKFIFRLHGGWNDEILDAKYNKDEINSYIYDVNDII